MSSIENYLQKKLHMDASYYLRGGFWTFTNQIIGIIGSLITAVFFTHMLTESGYGTYRYLIGLTGLFASFSLSGSGQAIMQATAKKYLAFYLESQKVNIILNLGVTLSALIVALYYFYQANIVLALGCLFIALIQPFVLAYQNIFPFLSGDRRYKENAIAQIFNVATMTLVLVLMLFITKNILMIFAAFLISNLLTFIATHIYFYDKNTTKTPKDIYKKYISYAIHTSLRNGITNIATRLDAIVLFQSIGAPAVAIYAVANIAPDQVKGAAKNIAAILIPKFVQHENLDSIKKHIPKRSMQLFLVLSFLTFIYILLVPYVYHVLFPKYPNAVIYSQLAALAFPSLVVYVPLNALQAGLLDKTLYKLNFSISIIQITLIIVLTSMFGIIGAIASKIIYRYAYAVTSYYFLYFSSDKNKKV